MAFPTEVFSAGRVGWIGLGSMGNAMAQNLQTHFTKEGLQPLRWYNRTLSRGKKLCELGAIQCDTISELFENTDLVFLSLSDDAAVKSVVQQVPQTDRTNLKILVDTTTIHPDTTKEISALLAQRGVQLVAAPVFGATPVAEAGRLLVSIAGPANAVDAVRPLLRGILARDVLDVGEIPEKAVMLKTVGNFITAGLMELVAEAHVLAEKSGIDSATLESLIEQNYGALAYATSQRMTQGVYCPAQGVTPYSGLELALKDVSHGVSSARDVNVSLGVGHLVLDHLRKAKAYSAEHNGRALDSSSLYGAVRMEAGLDFRTDLVKQKDDQARGK